MEGAGRDVKNVGVVGRGARRGRGRLRARGRPRKKQRGASDKGEEKGLAGSFWKIVFDFWRIAPSYPTRTNVQTYVHTYIHTRFLASMYDGVCVR